MSKTYLYPWVGRSCMKSNCQTSSGPLGSLKCLGAVRTGFPALWISLVAQLVKNLPAMQETWVQALDWEDPPEKGNATYSSFLAWKIPWGYKESDMTERLSPYFTSLDCSLDTWRRHFLCVALLMFPHQCWFMNAIILSVDQCFNAWTVVRSGDSSLY